jgi:hypothetical protein
MYIGRVQRAVVGRVIFLIMVWSSDGKHLYHFKSHIISWLSMRNFYNLSKKESRANG